jgi:hypothetical protein
LSLKQDRLSEKSSKKSSRSRPEHKYLADSINLESSKWAESGLASLEKEYHSAKTEEKRARIIQAIDDAILRTELESYNPSLTKTRKEELSKMQESFIRKKDKLTRKKSVTREPQKTSESDYDKRVVIEKLGKPKTVDELFKLSNLMENAKVPLDDPDIKSAFRKALRRVRPDLPAQPPFTGEDSFYGSTEIAKYAAMEATLNSGKKHNVRIDGELKDGRGSFRIVEAKTREKIFDSAKMEKVKLYRKRLTKHQEDMHQIESQLEFYKDALKKNPKDSINRSHFNQRREKLQAMERERQRMLETLYQLETQAKGSEHKERIERLKKMDAAVAKAKQVYFVATQVERRKLTSGEIQALVEILETHHQLQSKLYVEPYSMDLQLLTKLKAQLKSAPERDFQRIEWRIQNKRSYARIVDIEESDIERPKGFSERPTEAKKFTDLKGVGKDFEFWELSEFEYHRYKHFNEIRRLTGNIEYTQKALEEKREDGKFVIRGKKREEQMSHLDWWQKELKKMSETTPEETWKKKTETIYGYDTLVKKAIKSGKPVPQAVIDQYPEFKKAEDARERYEKGRHTSFANRSIAIDESMRAERGYKVKRQDGKRITKEQIAEISDGVSEVESILGPLDDMLRQTDITIAHTSGKHPFLSKSGGQYSPVEKTVTMGVAGVPSLAHELGHWLDLESGKKIRKGVEVKRGSKRIKLSSIAELNCAEGDDELIKEATKRMTDVYDTEKIMKQKLKDIEDPKERKRVQNIKVRLGHYWYTPVEIWARLFEQYVATEAESRGENFRVSVSTKNQYHTHPAYWSAEDFEMMKPMVEKQIQERIALIRAERVKEENR